MLNSGTLTVSGGLTGYAVTRETVYLAVYCADDLILTLLDISNLNLAGFSIFIEDMENAYRY